MGQLIKGEDMKKYIIVFALIFCSSTACAATPRMLVDKNTGRVITWGYTTFEPKENEIVVEDVYLTQGQDVNDGLRYSDGVIKSAPEFKTPTEKKPIELLQEAVDMLRHEVEGLKK